MLRVAEHFEKSDTGRQRRENEDSYFARAPLFAVADGMGGAQAGEVASRTAVETLEPGLPDGTAPEGALAEMARAANVRIHELAQASAERRGMGTTLTAVHVGEEDIAVAHVGDSRLYLWRDGSLERLTRDHSLVDELVRRGRLTEEEAAHHPQRSIITRALGPESDVEVDTRSYRARADDVFLICSDGLTGMVGEEDIDGILTSAGTLAEAGQALVDAANAAGGRDNITVVLFRLGAVDAPAPGAPAHAPGDQPTTESGAATDAPSALAEARAGVAEAPPRPRTAPPAAGRDGPGAGRRTDGGTRRRRRLLAPVLAVVVLLAIVGASAYFASQAVFFVGANDAGTVTIFRGLPYELPFGLKLYREEYVSGVTAEQVPAARRRKLLDHELRSESDARDLIDQLELGRLQ